MNALNEYHEHASDEKCTCASSAAQEMTENEVFELVQKHKENLLSEVSSPFILKAMAVMCIKSIAEFHDHIANRAFSEQEKACIPWAGDTGKLEVAHSILVSIATGPDDFMVSE